MIEPSEDVNTLSFVVASAPSVYFQIISQQRGGKKGKENGKGRKDRAALSTLRLYLLPVFVSLCMKRRCQLTLKGPPEATSGPPELLRAPGPPPLLASLFLRSSAPR